MTENVGSLALSLDELTDVIHGLGMARMAMTEGKKPASLSGRKVDFVPIPRLPVQRSPIMDGSAFLVDHPMFGPVGLLLSREEVAKMVRDLSAHLATPPAGSDTRN